MSETGEGEAPTIPEPITINKGSFLRFFPKNIQEVNRNIPEIGLPLAIHQHFESQGINIISEFYEGSEQAMRTDPILLIANHADLIKDSLGILGAIPANRTDVYATANAMHKDLKGNIAPHIIPIHGADNQKTQKLAERLRRRFLVDKNANMMSRMDQGRENIASIRMAIDQVNNGSIVLFFPEGANRTGEEWYDRVGDVVRRTTNPNAKVVFAKAQGHELRNAARLQAYRFGRIPGAIKLKVEFSTPHSMSEYQEIKSKHDITQILKDQYNKFAQ